MQTPWGKSDSITKIQRGVSWVGTPSHGGLAITQKRAVSLLSPEAVAQGEAYGAYLFFEEDDAYAIAFYEHPEWAVEMNLPAAQGASDNDIRASLLPVISLYRADYLLARGIKPAPAEYARYLRSKEDDRMHAEKHPHFVVAAEGDWAQGVPKGQVRIYTADGKRYFLPASEYVIGKRLGEYLVNIVEDKGESR